jgi:hypothetical protein
MVRIPSQCWGSGLSDASAGTCRYHDVVMDDISDVVGTGHDGVCRSDGPTRNELP